MLALQKLGAHENTKYTNYILPNKPEEMLFEETIETQSKMFGERDSLFYTRYKCLNIIKDSVAYTGKVNAQCERFKCLIFLHDLTSNKDKVIRSKILTMLEQDTEITLQKVSEEFQKLISDGITYVFYFLMYNKESTRLLSFCGGGEGSGHAFSKFSKGT